MAFGFLPQNTLGFVAPFLPNFAAIFLLFHLNNRRDQSRRTLTFSNFESFHLFFEYIRVYGRRRSPYLRHRHQVREHWIQFHSFSFEQRLLMLPSYKI